MKLKKNALKLIKEIKEDRLMLRKQNDLAEYGQGQLDLISLITEE